MLIAGKLSVSGEGAPVSPLKRILPLPTALGAIPSYSVQMLGLKIDDAKTGSTKTSITNVLEPNGVRLELLDFLPGSLPRQAIDNFK